MRNKGFVYHVYLLLVISLITMPRYVVAQFAESGQYPIYNFSPNEYNALGQNWCAVQDQRGIMYFGNNQGVLEYDGENWTLIPPVDGAPIKSMAIDKNNRVFFGSVNEFGYLVPDSLGNLNYYLLSNQLDEEYQNFNEIWETHVTDNGIVFQSYHYLFIWENDSLSVIHSEEEMHESYCVGGRLLISFSESGLGYLEDNRINPINQTGVSYSSSIYGMVEIASNKILIITDMDGLYQLQFVKDNPGQVLIEKIKTKNDQLFSNIEIYNAIRIDPNRISIGTWGYGSIIIDSLYNIVTIIDKDAGLQDQIVQGQATDESGNLWLALSSGLSRVEIHSDVTQFGDIDGIDGTIQSITRFNNRIYVATNVGLFFMDNKFYNADISNYKQPVFKPIEGIEIECWDMITYKSGNDEVLLVATNSNVFELSRDHKIKKVMDDYVFKIYQSKADSSRVYIGLESGLTSIYRKDGKWEQEEYISEIEEMITNLSEDHMGNLWMGTQEEGVLKMHIQNFEEKRIGEYIISRYNEDQGLPRGPFIVSQFKGPPTVATNEGLFKFNLNEDSFKPDSVYGKQFADGSLYIHRITEFSEPEIWMVTFSETAEYKYIVGYLSEYEPNSYKWISEPFIRLSEELIHGIFQEPGGVVWLGGSQGLFRYQMDTSSNYQQNFNSYIRGVELSDGSPVFNGSYMNDANIPTLQQPEWLKITLPYRNNSLVFNYSSLSGDDESFNRYSYFLDGNDYDWSEWTTETYRPYTNLREGPYAFRVKARNIYGHVSNEAIYEFTILAPWYRKWWAYTLYIFLAAIVVYTIVKVYTRQLREIIRERTAEVVSQKEVIEEKNKDIMDSIQYAEKIQRAMLPPEDDLARLGVDGFILFLPRDVVSGDFYWLAKQDGKIITVAADCTGHGVPGAFMSMLGVAFLNNIVGVQGIVKASEILNELRSEVIAALKQKGYAGEQKDGMDLALHIIDYDKMTLEFSGANNPLILIRDNELIQVKGDRMPIGIHELADQSFENHELEAIKGDVLYTFSDGYQDQFGGPKNKKFMIKKMKELLVEIHQKPMGEQKEILEKAFYDWTVPYDTEQVDDIIVIGIRI
ncbi:MAG: SpoIIE family protein phosphatase [Bacteroidales bacterium]|nr:SpoIIE family protein phosphatase [Bacteroidales bacterium]